MVKMTDSLGRATEHKGSAVCAETMPTLPHHACAPSVLLAPNPPITSITGASRGLGAAIAKALAREGMHLFLIARNKAKLDEVAADIERHQSVSASTALSSHEPCIGSPKA
jgi:short chain dehydrogenase